MEFKPRASPEARASFLPPFKGCGQPWLMRVGMGKPLAAPTICLGSDTQDGPVPARLCGAAEGNAGTGSGVGAVLG